MSARACIIQAIERIHIHERSSHVRLQTSILDLPAELIEVGHEDLQQLPPYIDVPLQALVHHLS